MATVKEIRIISRVETSQSKGSTTPSAWRSPYIVWVMICGILSLAASCSISAPPKGDRAIPVISTLTISTPAPKVLVSPSGFPVPKSSTLPIQTPATTTATTTESTGRSTDDLWSLLRQGKGIVVMLRHAIAPGTGDPANFQIEDCSTQRNLSAAGRQQAMQIGAMLRQQRVPVARVLSSQWCRCLETARLMDIAPVEPFPMINSFFGDRSTEAQQTAALKQFIEENRESQGVIFLVTHQVNITAVTGVVPQQGEALILQADQPNQPKVLGELLLGN
jgi:phosphohistidine phosphatase SixA